MNQHLSAHELLHGRLTTTGQLDHPGNQLFRSVLDEYGVALAAHALAEERLADCRRAAAALHETVMSILEAARDGGNGRVRRRQSVVNAARRPSHGRRTNNQLKEV